MKPPDTLHLRAELAAAEALFRRGNYREARARFVALGAALDDTARAIPFDAEDKDLIGRRLRALEVERFALGAGLITLGLIVVAFILARVLGR